MIIEALSLPLRGIPWRLLIASAPRSNRRSSTTPKENEEEEIRTTTTTRKEGKGKGQAGKKKRKEEERDKGVRNEAGLAGVRVCTTVSVGGLSRPGEEGGKSLARFYLRMMICSLRRSLVLSPSLAFSA